MNNDKIDECKCEKCLQTIPDSSDVQSLGDYDILCESCIDTFQKCAGYDCNEVGMDFTVCSNGNPYCESCEDDLSVCYGCEELIDGNQHSLYSYECDTYCSDCAQSQTAYECSCGDSVSIEIAVGYEDYDYVINEMCEECWDRRGKIDTIDDAVETSIDKSVLDRAYIQQSHRPEEKLTEAQSNDYNSFSRFFNKFYGYTEDDYKSQKLIIRKGAFGYERWGWFETSMEIRSKVNEQIFKMLDYLITDNSQAIKRPHRKFGRYQPFAYTFAELCEFYIQTTIPNGDEESVWLSGENRYVRRSYPSSQLVEFQAIQKKLLEDGMTWSELNANGNLWMSYYVDFLDRAKLRECVNSRKMPNGKCLIKTINKLLTQHTKSYQTYEDDYREDTNRARTKHSSHPSAKTDKDKILTSYRFDSAWSISGTNQSIWNKYCTNSINETIPARIGFDAQAHEKVISFNDDIGACQGASYKHTLGFNHISMSSNPHLYFLFYDPQDESSIVGRSVIRLLWARDTSQKRGYGEPLKKILYIAPSRLYQKGYTHAKNQFYAGMYKALDEWKDVIAKRLGADEVKLIAYHKTRHDSYSIKDYVKFAEDNQISVINTKFDPETDERKLGKFVTDWFYPIWLEKPNNDDGNGAYWGYYPDEYQGYETSYVDSSVYSEYATRETYNGHYSYIEVKNE